MNSSFNLNESNNGGSSTTRSINNSGGSNNLNASSNSVNSNGSNSTPTAVGYTIDNVVNRGMHDFKYSFTLPSREQILNLKQGDLVKLIFTEGNQAERMFVEILDLCLYDSNNEIASSNSGGNSLKQGIEIFHDLSISSNGNGGSYEDNIHKDEKNKSVNNNNNNNNNSNINKSGSIKKSSGGGDDFNLNYNSIRFQGKLDNNPYQLKSLKLGNKVEFFDYNILSIYNQPNQLYHPDLDCVPSAIKQLFDQLCLVSNRILVDKDHIGYIFRENATFPNDSGWRIFQGDEPDDYMNKKENYQLVSLASVLNIDDSILLLLSSSIDRHFEFDFDSSQWKELVEK